MKISALILSLALSCPLVLEAKLLNKLVGVVGDQIITLSELTQVKTTLKARVNISPILFPNEKMSENDVLKRLTLIKLVRTKLESIGIVVADVDVESEIKSKESTLNLSRKQLNEFLAANGLTFDEFFELVRATLEYSTFVPKIITPLISIPEQEIKNIFYKENSNNTALAFKYSLIDYTLPESVVKKVGLAQTEPVVAQKHKGETVTSLIDETIEMQELSDVSADDITPAISQVLKVADEGSFATPVLISGKYHFFYLKEKNLEESSLFLKHKNRIHSILMEKKVQEMVTFWQTEEEQTQYVKYSL